MNKKFHNLRYVIGVFCVLCVCLAFLLQPNLRSAALSSATIGVPPPVPTPYVVPTPNVAINNANSAFTVQQTFDYQPQFHQIARLSHIPQSIRRAASSNKRSRFFGTFRQNNQTFALHFYDQSRVYSKREYDSVVSLRRSRLDIFALNAAKHWRKNQSCAVLCRLNDEHGRVQVEAQWLPLNAKRPTSPLIYLRVRAPNAHDWSYGSQTAVYGVLLPHSNTDAFAAFDCYNPLLNSQVTSTDVSFPDANGNLTIVFTASNPGYNDCQAYGWTGKAWKSKPRRNIKTTKPRFVGTEQSSSHYFQRGEEQHANIEYSMLQNAVISSAAAA